MRYWIVWTGLLLPGLLVSAAVQEHKEHEKHKEHGDHKKHRQPMHHHEWSVDEWVERLESPSRGGLAKT